MHSVQCPRCKNLISRPLSMLSLALCPSCGEPLPQRRHLVSVVRSASLRDALRPAESARSRRSSDG
jgi:hypothetical protein